VRRPAALGDFSQLAEPRRAEHYRRSATQCHAVPRRGPGALAQLDSDRTRNAAGPPLSFPTADISSAGAVPCGRASPSRELFALRVREAVAHPTAINFHTAAVLLPRPRRPAPSVACAGPQVDERSGDGRRRAGLGFACDGPPVDTEHPRRQASPSPTRSSDAIRGARHTLALAEGDGERPECWRRTGD
jgi:hypothetical protein